MVRIPDELREDSATRMGFGPGDVVLGQYEIEELLGRGGMGEVYRARDLELDRAVALKVLPAFLTRSQRAAAALKAEAAKTIELTHPSIARIYHLGVEEEQPVLVMELIDGESLADRLDRQGPGTLDEVLDWLESLADALDYAHGKRVIHRDIKPSNILVRGDGTPVLIDFGIAGEVKDQTSRQGPTRPDEVNGTLSYMSPEQLKGKRPSPAMDVYSLAATAYELLGGEPPFFRGDSQAVSYQVVNEPPEPLEELPEEVNAGLLRGLAKVPGERPATATGLVRALAGERRPALLADDPAFRRRTTRPRDAGSTDPAAVEAAAVAAHATDAAAATTGPALLRAGQRRLVGVVAIVSLLAVFGASRRLGGPPPPPPPAPATSPVPGPAPAASEAPPSVRATAPPFPPATGTAEVPTPPAPAAATPPDGLPPSPSETRRTVRSPVDPPEFREVVGTLSWKCSGTQGMRATGALVRRRQQVALVTTRYVLEKAEDLLRHSPFPSAELEGPFFQLASGVSQEVGERLPSPDARSMDEGSRDFDGLWRDHAFFALPGPLPALALEIAPTPPATGTELLVVDHDGRTFPVELEHCGEGHLRYRFPGRSPGSESRGAPVLDPAGRLVGLHAIETRAESYGAPRLGYAALAGRLAPALMAALDAGP